MLRVSSTQPRPTDVRLPPPLVYAAPLALAWALDRAIPLRMPGSRWRKAVGWTLVAAGEAISFSGAATFRRNRTTIIPGHTAATLVTTGPYMYTRNPMYLGLTVGYVGSSLVLGTWWAPIALPAVVAYIDRNVIRREEATLREQFGEQYEEFSTHTRRWV